MAEANGSRQAQAAARARGRLAQIRPAQRRRMFGRMMIAGPAGSGKTWTGLSMASTLANGEPILVIDTERDSALAYADAFSFQHLPWRPPFDPAELADTLRAIEPEQFGVVMIDSLTHFWRGIGGTLELAGSKIQGWANARPVQEALIDTILAVPAHVILCVRSKMTYAVEDRDGRTRVEKLGLNPMQDDTLPYETNVAFDIDLEHRLTVTKSRTTALPVGRMYPAGQEQKAARDYLDWLEGGAPPAPRAEVQRLVDLIGTIGDPAQRKATKALFVELFGMPDMLTADAFPQALAWIEERIAALGDVDAAADELAHDFDELNSDAEDSR